MTFPELTGCGRAALWAAALAASTGAAADAAPAAGAPPIDFNRDVRPILSNTCFRCHGPDPAERKGGNAGGLRLDIRDGATADLGGYAAIVAGSAGESELIARVTHPDPDEVMPPPKAGQRLTPGEVDVLRRWIDAGAPYARHWSYVPPGRPPLPEVPEALRRRVRNPVDNFIFARLERENLAPSPEAPAHTLARRAALDLTGLPPTPGEVERLSAEAGPGAFDRYVEALLKKKSYGEHWARQWLDLARYADSSGYADDPPRTIWAYRDYVIRALNANKPFDQFTLEQLAGDLLPDPTEEQLVATAFHRNTQTNNEGGTNDEEYRNVAVVDRVNTTMAVWMGTTMACAQCHTHKYDPISQEEYFRLFALLNNTEDADRRDEAPTINLFLPEQKAKKTALKAEIAALEKTLATPTPEVAAAQQEWESGLAGELPWQRVVPGEITSPAGATLRVLRDGAAALGETGVAEPTTLSVPLDDTAALAGIQIEAAPLKTDDDAQSGAGLNLARISATLNPPDSTRPAGRFVRVELPGKGKILSLAEVQVFAGETNHARGGKARQSSTSHNGEARLAVDGNTDGDFNRRSTTHTETSENPWWEVDLGEVRQIDRVVVWNRTDGNVGNRLGGFRVSLLGPDRETIWEQTEAGPPQPSTSLALSNVRPLEFAAALDTTDERAFRGVALTGKSPAGWTVATGGTGRLALLLKAPVEVPPGSTLALKLDPGTASSPSRPLGHIRLAVTADPRAVAMGGVPADLLTLLLRPAADRAAPENARLAQFYRGVTPLLAPQRERLAKAKQEATAIKPGTTVPVLRERPANKRRVTHIQRRGNFLDKGAEVAPGLPGAFRELPAATDGAGSGDGAGSPDRLQLVRYLVDGENPLTARVVVNRLWESIFGIGLVRTSEEFGSQGELPSHPALLDWLACELVDSGWDLQHILKLLVTSSTYRQSSAVTPELLERDPDNRLLARGPRFRLSAEMVRDQALFVSGLLSDKLYGPPVKPPQPQLGIKAAFGGGIDWSTSKGEDRYRRGLYTTWRRSNPYPSMATFDAPNREVCTVRRDRTNTPLQALVTLNDPVFFEAAQALGRRMAGAEDAADTAARARHGFFLCLSRQPSETELARLIQLYDKALAHYTAHPDLANKAATQPLGPLPAGADPARYAAWTLVGNVLLNLDEMFLKR